MKYIKLTQDKFAKVSDIDYEYLNQFKWCAYKDGNSFYAIRSIRHNGKQTNIRMHRVILERIGYKLEHVDHIDHNGLNNTRENIRPCTSQENKCNRTKQKNNTSGFKGVSWHKASGKWETRIGMNGKTKYLGLFDDPKDAAEAYKQAARKLHKDFYCE